MAEGGWSERLVERGGRRLMQMKATIACLVVLFATLVVVSPTPSAWVVDQASTNLHNLAHGRVDTLVTSMLIVGNPGRRWWACLALLFLLVERAWGSRRFVWIVVAGHVGATLVVAALLVVGINLSWFPTAWSTAEDVGISYAVLGVIGAATAMWSALPRLVWVTAWTWTLLENIRRSPDFSSYGHLVAFCIGVALSAWVLVGRPAVPQRTRPERAVRPVDASLAGLAAGVLVEDGLPMHLLEPVLIGLALWSVAAWLGPPALRELRRRQRQRQRRGRTPPRHAMPA
ncbi:MAG: hypothetical protein JWN46_1461, partial [Acidimicrobiales bacterium]|nr:hypothetical protein [Acidimicrobiales bacterium]